jgi:hypothetical protein
MRRTGQSGKVRGQWAAIAVVLVCASPVVATSLDMAKLPLSEPFRCTVCHAENPEAGGGTELNVFGVDFLANLRVWNAALAELDSDRDGCLNGVELGDSDGDRVADGNIDHLTTNPGAADCGSSLDGATWGELKALFESR